MGGVRTSLLAALVLCGCLEKIGVGDPDAAGAPQDASDVRDGAEADDAARPGDAGEDAGTPPKVPLRFGTMTLPAGTIAVTTIWGRSASELYTGTTNGNVLAFAPSAGWQVVWHEPSNFGIQRIRGTAQTIFVASDHTLYVHAPGIGQNVRSFPVGTAIHDLLVVSDTEAYLVSDQQNGRAVFRFDGTAVAVMNDQLDAATLLGVYRDAGGTLFIAANGKIFRYQSDTWTQDPIAWPPGFGVADIANFDLYAITRVGPDLLVVGDEHHVLRFEPDAGEWRFVYEPMSGAYLAAIGALSGGEAYAVGRAGADGPVVRYAAGVFSHPTYPENHNFLDLFVAGPDEIFAAGVVGSTLEPVIMRGFR